ncbi:hypothetical protein HVY04_04445 [Citrobacter freundii]|uniref:hypothetical protein n=1 Tax=Citrobacter freundii TaxID=546 RepID=UPI0015EA2917|nr:hypothetical protein [Citrobacter freundii]QMJ02400.1 hypothetical protein HVY06_04445 [Citrobacter freundii]QMJ11470.1 hypothetical protein HVY04_04445 [Citrobacter freundii]
MKTVKLYIEPASLPLTQQLLNYIRSYTDDNVINIIAFQRLTLNTDYINQKTTAFIDNINAGLSEKIIKIAGFIHGVKPSQIEIHTNIHRERDILFPLMKLLAPTFSLTAIKLHLYDDGSASLIERAAIESLDSREFERLMLKRKAQLLGVLSGKDKKDYDWNIVDNYIWHYVLDVTYYFISPPQRIAANAFYEKLERHVVYSHFNVQDRVSAQEKALLLRLVNFPQKLYHTLTTLQQEPDALLFITSYCPDPEKTMMYHQRLIALIASLKTNGKIPNESKIIFKGHPENKALNHEVCRAIGPDVIRVPDEIPIEFLTSFNLLPRNIGGEFSSTFFCMENMNVQFIILKGSPDDRANKAFYAIANKYQAFDTQKVIYL